MASQVLTNNTQVTQVRLETSEKCKITATSTFIYELRRNICNVKMLTFKVMVENVCKIPARATFISRKLEGEWLFLFCNYVRSIT